MITAILKMLPIMLLVTGAAVAWHDRVVSDLESQLQNKTTQLENQQQQLQACELARQAQVSTIQGLREDNQEIATTVNQLTQQNNAIAEERDRYLSVFRRHNLNELSYAKPELIETRINRGTQDMFRSIEQHTEELPHEDVDGSIDDSSN